MKEEYPRDGYYKEDIKALFPSYVAEQIERFYESGGHERLEMQIDEHIKLYYHSWFSTYNRFTNLSKWIILNKIGGALIWLKLQK